MTEEIQELPLNETAIEKEVTAEKIVYDRNNRFVFIDNIRGLVIFIWTVAFCIYWFEFSPGWLGHYPQDKSGVGVADLGIVAYIFIMSLMMVYNYRRSIKNKGAMQTNRHYIYRSIMLMGIGFFVGYVLNFPNGPRWSVLVTYGFCTLLSLAFMPVKKAEIRLAIGAAILIAYQIAAVNIQAMNDFISGHDGEIIGAISYLGTMIICSALGEMYFSNKKKFYIYSGAVGAATLLIIMLNIIVPEANAFSRYIFINKYQQTLGYMLTTVSVILALFILADKLKYLHKSEVPLINSIGQSSLFFFIIGGIFMGLSLIIIGKSPVDGYIQGGTFMDMIICVMTVQIPVLTIAWLFKKYKIKVAI